MFGGALFDMFECLLMWPSTVIQEVTREGLRGFDPLPAQRTDQAGT